MTQNNFIILIFLFCSCQNHEEKQTPELNVSDGIVWNKKERELRTFIKQTDIHFGENWVLEKDSVEEIDHFENGLVLTWTKSENGIKYVRYYVFELDSQFVSAYEER